LATISVALLEQELIRVALRKMLWSCALHLKFLWADVKAGTWKLFCFVGKQNIFGRGEKKGTCFYLKIGLSTEAASFSLLGVFCLIACFKRYVKTCRERGDAQKPLNC
jgi:hypothetical protein